MGKTFHWQNLVCATIFCDKLGICWYDTQVCVITHVYMHFPPSILPVLVIQEQDRELRFSMVDGDFKKFEGKWSVKSQKGYATIH